MQSSYGVSGGAKAQSPLDCPKPNLEEVQSALQGLQSRKDLDTKTPYKGHPKIRSTWEQLGSHEGKEMAEPSDSGHDW